MLISELNFPHLLAEQDARRDRELERRRVIALRLAEQALAAHATEQPHAHRRWHRRTLAPAEAVC